MSKTALPVIEYVSVPVPEGTYKLSPSGLSTFRRNPHEFRHGSTFKGNISSITGTCVHYLFECCCILLRAGNTQDNIRERYASEIENGISFYLAEEVGNDTIGVNKADEISKSMMGLYFPHILTYVMNNYFSIKGMTIENEVQLAKQVAFCKDGTPMVIAGSTDAIVTDVEAGTKTITDFKWTKQRISKIDSYEPQLMSYAYAAGKVTHIEVVNINYTKTRGVEIKSYKKKVTKQMQSNYASLVKEIHATVSAADKYPELENLLFRKGVDFLGKFTLGE